MRDIVNGWLLPEQDGPAAQMWRSLWLRANMTKTSNTEQKDDDSVSSEESNTSRRSVKNSLSLNLTDPNPKYHGTPWRIGKEPYPAGIIGLHREVEDYYEYIKPTPAEHAMRLSIVQRYSDLIKQLWPEAVVDHFGSFKTGLYLPTSDIDMVVLGKWESMPLYSLHKHLLDSGLVEKKTLKVLDKATVPIIKLVDLQTEIKVDISFNTSNGLKSVQLIQEYIATYPTLVKLVFVLKQYLLQRDLKDVFTGGISSYSLILLVVSFLQRHPREEARSISVNLGVLLLEFFEHYGKYFNYYQNAIRVTNGGSLISKNELMAYDSTYSPSILTIEDPLDATNDIGKNSYGALHVKHAFESAFSNLYRALGPLKATVDPLKSILGRIICISDELVDKRKEIATNSPWSKVDSSRSNDLVDHLEDPCSVSPKSDQSIPQTTSPVMPVPIASDCNSVQLNSERTIDHPLPQPLPTSRASSLEPHSKNLKLNSSHHYKNNYPLPPQAPSLPMTPSSYPIPMLQVHTTHSQSFQSNFPYYTGVHWPIFPMNNQQNPPIMNMVSQNKSRFSRYQHPNSNRPRAMQNWKNSQNNNHSLNSNTHHNNAQRSSSSSSPSSDEGISNKTNTDKISQNNVAPYKRSGMVYQSR